MTKPAIGELAGGGTAFAVTGELGLTAVHAVGAEGTDTEISLADGATVPVRVTSVAADVDLALLELRGPLPAGCAPLRLSDEVASHDAFRARGYPSLPELDREVAQMAIAGEVTEVGTLLDGVGTLQLSVREAAATQPLSLHGMSGGPVLVGEDDLVVGIVRCPGGATLVATIRSDRLARGLSPEHGLVPEAARTLQRLEERAGQPVVVERLSDAEELQRAAWAYPEEQFTSGVGIAERLGRAAEVRSRYRGETSPLRQALIRAAIDLTRVGRGPTVPSSRLREWFTAYVQGDRPFDEVSDAAYTEALA